MPAKAPLLVRAMRKARLNSTTGCLVWHGATIHDSPVMTEGGRIVYVRRTVHELFRGGIPPKARVFSFCGDPRCVRLGHLFCATPHTWAWECRSIRQLIVLGYCEKDIREAFGLNEAVELQHLRSL
jgi:hypothetical protein